MQAQPVNASEESRKRIKKEAGRVNRRWRSFSEHISRRRLSCHLVSGASLSISLPSDAALVNLHPDRGDPQAECGCAKHHHFADLPDLHFAIRLDIANRGVRPTLSRQSIRERPYSVYYRGVFSRSDRGGECAATRNNLTHYLTVYIRILPVPRTWFDLFPGA